MFCKNCGNQCADTDNVCSNCGTRLKAASAAPTATGASGFDLAPYVKFIALGVAALALIFGIMNLFGMYDVNVSVSAMGMSQDIPAPVSELYEGSAMLSVANVLYGFILLAVAAVAALYGMKELNGMPYYDQFITKLPFSDKPLTLIGGAAAAGAILQFILYMTADIKEAIGEYMGGMSSYLDMVDISISVHWSTWIMILLGVAMVVVDMFVLNKKTAE